VHEDLRLDLADCSLIVLARRFKTRRILSFDERHFRAVAPLQGGAFSLLPADA
jgi:predicted nucleic acid-binding protein